MIPTTVLLSPDGGLTLLAPLVAIALALLTRRVVPSLSAGVFVGALVARNGDLGAAFTTIFAFDLSEGGAPGYLQAALFDRDHLLKMAGKLNARLEFETNDNLHVNDFHFISTTNDQLIEF